MDDQACIIQKNDNNVYTRQLFYETFNLLINNMGKASISVKGLSKSMEDVVKAYKIVVSYESNDAVIAQLNTFFDQVEIFKNKTTDKNIQDLMVDFVQAKIEFNDKVATGACRKGSEIISNKNAVLVSVVGMAISAGPRCPC